MMRLSAFKSWNIKNCSCRSIIYLNDCNYILLFRNFRRKRIINFQHSFYVTSSNEDVKSEEWYPKHVTDLDHICDKVIMYDPNNCCGLDANHPSFKDKEYRKRREWFLKISNDYKHGTPIPRMDYTTAETKTWSTIYRDLKILHNKFACKEFLDNFKLLEEQCGYSEKQIPQLEDISKYLQTKTGFTLRPCGGYLTPRNFLTSLAFRVFCCTQYIRHHTDPHYTPEPDLCHELLGHMAMFLNPTYAQLSQEIGIASLNCSEKDCNALIRFGLLVEGETFDEKKRNLKAYGAGLLSCFDELKFSVSSDAKICRFEPDDVIEIEPEVTKFQKCYFYSMTINEAFHKIKSYISTIKRPYSFHYDPLTQSIKKLTNDLH
uniref:Biopterin-dependent aromatic amino acid hydroxylase family profile domain-containing protein n=1 Tax=Brugia malayi TaxID=6279 RepID=A0A7I4NNL9_BRUMA